MLKIKSIIAILLPVLFLSCATLPSRTIRPVCRHTSVLTALTFGENYPVRIAVGPSYIKDGKQIWHAQAQYRNEYLRWNWIIFDGENAVHAEQERFKPVYFLTIKEFIERYIPKFKEFNSDK